MPPCTNKDNVLELSEINKTYHINPTGNPNSRSERWEIFKKTLFGNKNKKDTRENFFALKDVSLEIKKSESLGIIGLNGSGKSTLVQIIAGTLQPTSGNISVNGQVAALLELGSGFNPDFTGKENVFINGKILGMGKEEIKSKLDENINFTETELISQFPFFDRLNYEKKYNNLRQLKNYFFIPMRQNIRLIKFNNKEKRYEILSLE